MENVYNGSSCCLRLVDLNDSGSILALRNDPSLSRFVSSVAGDLKSQQDWISKYKERERLGEEFYFAVIVDGQVAGTTRLYHIDYMDRIFTGGSWVVKKTDNPIAAIEAMLATYSFAFDGLGMEIELFDVRKANTSVLAFHESTGARFFAESEIDKFGIRTRRMYESYMKKMARALPVNRFSAEDVGGILKDAGIKLATTDALTKEESR